MTTTRPTRPTRLLTVLAVGGLALAGCAGDPDPPGGGGGGATSWPAPYGQTRSGDEVAWFCGARTGDVDDILVRDDGGAESEIVRAVSGTSAPAASRSVPAASGTPVRTMLPWDEGVITGVGIRQLDDATTPVMELELTLTGPAADDPYIAESVAVSFLSADGARRWVGFPLTDEGLGRDVPLDEPIAPSPDGATTTFEVVPVACPAGTGSTWTVAPLPDGSYDLSIFGTAAPADRPNDDHRYAVWGQEFTRVTVSDGIVRGVGYDGPNSYSR